MSCSRPPPLSSHPPHLPRTFWFLSCQDPPLPPRYKAHAADHPDAPLAVSVLAHSLGSVILYDLLAHAGSSFQAWESTRYTDLLSLIAKLLLPSLLYSICHCICLSLPLPLHHLPLPFPLPSLSLSLFHNSSPFPSFPTSGHPVILAPHRVSTIPSFRFTSTTSSPAARLSRPLLWPASWPARNSLPLSSPPLDPPSTPTRTSQGRPVLSVAATTISTGSPPSLPKAHMVSAY